MARVSLLPLSMADVRKRGSVHRFGTSKHNDLDEVPPATRTRRWTPSVGYCICWVCQASCLGRTFSMLRSDPASHTEHGPFGRWCRPWQRLGLASNLTTASKNKLDERTGRSGNFPKNCVILIPARYTTQCNTFTNDGSTANPSNPSNHPMEPTNRTTKPIQPVLCRISLLLLLITAY